MPTYQVYVEQGSKKAFAGALAWPGWCRGGRDEAGALQALVTYGPRYAQVLQVGGVVFAPPADVAELRVVERPTGSAGTDFGAPGARLAGDGATLDAPSLAQQQAILLACWWAFDDVIARAAGRELRKGPRGGGRETAQIVAHVLESEQHYLGRLGWKVRPISGLAIPALMATIDEALAAAARGELPTHGPRGGAMWPIRFYLRYAAWHVLDHVWEIEDRLT